MIGHSGLFEVVYAQTVGYLGLAMENTAPLSSGLIVPRVVIAEGDCIHPM